MRIKTSKQDPWQLKICWHKMKMDNSHPSRNNRNKDLGALVILEEMINSFNLRTFYENSIKLQYAPAQVKILNKSINTRA